MVSLTFHLIGPYAIVQALTTRARTATGNSTHSPDWLWRPSSNFWDASEWQCDARLEEGEYLCRDRASADRNRWKKRVRVVK